MNLKKKNFYPFLSLPKQWRCALESSFRYNASPCIFYCNSMQMLKTPEVAENPPFHTTIFLWLISPFSLLSVIEYRKRESFLDTPELYKRFFVQPLPGRFSILVLSFLQWISWEFTVCARVW